jgi:hypothetical protein
VGRASVNIDQQLTCFQIRSLVTDDPEVPAGF